jgi:hypothetical protein
LQNGRIGQSQGHEFLVVFSYRFQSLYLICRQLVLVVVLFFLLLLFFFLYFSFMFVTFLLVLVTFIVVIRVLVGLVVAAKALVEVELRTGTVRSVALSNTFNVCVCVRFHYQMLNNVFGSFLCIAIIALTILVYVLV